MVRELDHFLSCLKLGLEQSNVREQTKKTGSKKTI